MANRVKEDEKNERIIRGLLKLPENRRCINCNSLGPQYVCTSFWAFVCTNCSGIHREFTHRVKSVSMAKFTSQEVSSLQGGGNQRAKEIYFKEWDSQRNSAPDGSNVERLRDFIKHVYVDRRFSSDRGAERPPRTKSDKEDSYQGGSRSPPYEDAYDRRYSDRSSPGGRSPGYDQETRQYNDNKRSPSRPEIINDWRREDRFRNGRKSDDRSGESKIGGSPERPRDLDTSSPPVVRPVREILGENVVPLRIGEPPKANGIRAADSSVQTQRTASSSSLGSTSGNAAEVKWQSSASLIDFDAEPEPPAVVVSQAQPPNQAIVQPTSAPSENNWASFDVSPQVNASEPHPNVNSLDSVLSQLSVPASSPAPLSGGPIVAGAPGAASIPTGVAPILPLNAGVPTNMPGSSLSAPPQPGPSGIVPGQMTGLPPNGGISFGMQPQQPSLFPGNAVHSTHQSTVPVGGSSSIQPWNVPVAPNSQGHLSSASLQPFVSKSPELVAGAASQTFTAEVKPSGRRELPADLFTATYSPYPAAVQMWQTPYGMGYNMQYNPVMIPLQPRVMPLYPQPPKSVNPFDVNDIPSVQPPTFPSMGSLQGALPNVPPSSGLMHPSASGTPSPSPAWATPQPSSYAPGMPPQAPTLMPAMTQGAYMGQQMPANMPPTRPQGFGGFGNEGLSTTQHLTGNFSAPYTPNPSAPVGGNPFG